MKRPAWIPYTRFNMALVAASLLSKLTGDTVTVEYTASGYKLVRLDCSGKEV